MTQAVQVELGMKTIATKIDCRRWGYAEKVGEVPGKLGGATLAEVWHPDGLRAQRLLEPMRHRYLLPSGDSVDGCHYFETIPHLLRGCWLSSVCLIGFALARYHIIRTLCSPRYQ